MATSQKCEPSKAIGSISRIAGTLVGTAVVTGKRIVGSVTTSSWSPSKKHKEKTGQASVKSIKKVVHKPATKAPKTKKKKVVKRKGKGLSGKNAASQGKHTQPSSKKKKVTSPKKKTVH